MPPPWRGILKVFHWGPFISLFLITTIATVTFFIPLRLFFHPSQGLGSLINFAVFLFFVVQIVVNYFMAMMIGPGLVPHHWGPENKADQSRLQWCETCDGFKAPRAHHCKHCQRCVMKMDHHCPWVNTCVGALNHKNFVLFLFYVPLGCLHAATMNASMLYGLLFHGLYRRHMEPLIYLLLIAFALACAVALAVSFLFYEQVTSIAVNTTGIEDWIITKAHSRERDGPFVYPYRLPTRVDNLREVLGDHVALWPLPWGRNRRLDGLHWPVVAGCDQYTLTEEQLAQKRLKRQRLVRVRVSRAFRGYCGLLWGPCTLWHCPFIDDPRLRVRPDDEVDVSRKRKYWLYAQRAEDPRARGWFPRACVNEDDCEPRTERPDEPTGASPNAASARGGKKARESKKGR